MKDIDTETRNNTVADDVTAGEDMAVERGVKLSRPIERGGEKSHMWRSPGLLSRRDPCVVCRCLMC